MDAQATEYYKGKLLDFFNDYYLDQINDMYVSYPTKRSVMIDIRDLQKFDIEIAEELAVHPDSVLPIANEALASMNPNPNAKDPVYARFMGNETSVLIQDVGSEYISKMLTLDALVVKRSEITPMVRIGVFKCGFCDTIIKVKIDSDIVPEVCPQCRRRSMKQEINDQSEFINLQKIAVQDPLERLRGNTPTWQLEVWIEDDLVNTIIPGDRIDVTGILRIRPRKNSRGKEEKFLYTMLFDAIAIKPKQKDYAEINITENEEREIHELAKDPKIFEKIAKSIAPPIYGYIDIKKALALQLFGGTPDKKLVDGAPIRSDIHMLLIGDPGSAKTRLLQAVTALVPKGIYVSGKSTSSAGLTASAERDEFSEGGWTLKAGALVLGSGGEVSIDEFDKISDEDKSSLHEALESQTISVAKAGIVASFNAKTTVLAAANPKHGRFDPNVFPAEQFNIPPALLSRFDLIFPIRDIMDEKQDRNIAKHILTQHQAAGAMLGGDNTQEQVEAPPIDSEMLRKYIAYAKRSVKPVLTTEASNKIIEYYVGLRKIGLQRGAVPLTPRQIEGLIRLAEASAKTRLAEKVELSDAELAISLFEHMMTNLAVDRMSRMDIDSLITGMPREKVDKMNLIFSIIKDLDKTEKDVTYTRVLEKAEEQGMTREQAGKYIDELDRSGDIFKPRPGIIKIVKRDDEQ